MRAGIPLYSATRLGCIGAPFEPSLKVHICVQARSAFLPAGLPSVNVRLATLQPFPDAILAFVYIVRCTTSFADSALRKSADHAILVAREA